MKKLEDGKFLEYGKSWNKLKRMWNEIFFAMHILGITSLVINFEGI